MREQQVGWMSICDFAVSSSEQGRDRKQDSMLRVTNKQQILFFFFSILLS
jgi:hypothetical protein